MKLHIFNPENDMALASGSPGYTPPANIRAYRRQHWQLPRQWAAPEDMVWDGESSLAHLFVGAAAVPERHGGDKRCGAYYLYSLYFDAADSA